MAEVDVLTQAHEAALQSQQLCLASCVGHLYGAHAAAQALGVRDDITIVALQDECDELITGRLHDAVTFVRETTPDSDGQIRLAFDAEFCTNICQSVRSFGVVGSASPPIITKCVASHDMLLLHMKVEEDLLELQVQSRPVATEERRHIVTDPQTWAMSTTDEIPWMQEFNITGYVGLELTAKLEGLQPASAHEFRTRAYRSMNGQGSWGLWSETSVYQTLSRPAHLIDEVGSRNTAVISTSPPRAQSPSRLFIGGCPPSPQQLIDREIARVDLSP